MDARIKKFLLHKGSQDGGERFQKLHDFIEWAKIDIQEREITGANGFALYDKVVIDLIKTFECDDDLGFFIILHELAHYMKGLKESKDHVVNLYLLDDFEQFFQEVKKEEMFADKFANIWFYRLSGESIDMYQFDHVSDDEYKSRIEVIYSMINSKEDYYRVCEAITSERDDAEFEKFMTEHGYKD